MARSGLIPSGMEEKMARFQYPNSLRSLETKIRELHAMEASMIHQEPRLGVNSGIVREAINDLAWSLVFLRRVHRVLSEWQTIESQREIGLVRKPKKVKLRPPGT